MSSVSYTDTDTDTNSDTTDTDTDSNDTANTDAYAYTNTNTNADSHSHSHTHSACDQLHGRRMGQLERLQRCLRRRHQDEDALRHGQRDERRLLSVLSQRDGLLQPTALPGGLRSQQLGAMVAVHQNVRRGDADSRSHDKDGPAAQRASLRQSNGIASLQLPGVSRLRAAGRFVRHNEHINHHSRRVRQNVDHLESRFGARSKQNPGNRRLSARKHTREILQQYRVSDYVRQHQSWWVVAVRIRNLKNVGVANKKGKDSEGWREREHRERANDHRS